MKHTHLIPADFEDYNIDDLIKESDNNANGVCWKNGGENGEYAQAFNVGDIVYIYFHDSKSLTDRILVKAKVCKSDCSDDGSDSKCETGLYSEYCKLIKNNNEFDVETREQLSNDAKTNIKGFYLNDFKAISREQEDDFKYIHGNREDIKNGETGIMGVHISQTKIYLDKHDEIKYLNLLNALEAANFDRKLKDFKKDYNNSCVLCEQDEKDIHSFKKNNGLYYFEVHHILQKNFNNKVKKNNDFDWFNEDKYGIDKKNKLIYNDYNEVRLCPYHHRILHYGKYEDRKKNLDRLIKKQKYTDNLFKVVKNEKDCEKIMDYVYEQYKVSRLNS